MLSSSSTLVSLVSLVSPEISVSIVLITSSSSVCGVHHVLHRFRDKSVAGRALAFFPWLGSAVLGAAFLAWNTAPPQKTMMMSPRRWSSLSSHLRLCRGTSLVSAPSVIERAIAHATICAIAMSPIHALTRSVSFLVASSTATGALCRVTTGVCDKVLLRPRARSLVATAPQPKSPRRSISTARSTSTSAAPD